MMNNLYEKYIATTKSIMTEDEFEMAADGVCHDLMSEIRASADTRLMNESINWLSVKTVYRANIAMLKTRWHRMHHPLASMQETVSIKEIDGWWNYSDEEHFEGDMVMYVEAPDMFKGHAILAMVKIDNADFTIDYDTLEVDTFMPGYAFAIILDNSDILSWNREKDNVMIDGKYVGCWIASLAEDIVYEGTAKYFDDTEIDTNSIETTYKVNPAIIDALCEFRALPFAPAGTLNFERLEKWYDQKTAGNGDIMVINYPRYGMGDKVLAVYKQGGERYEDDEFSFDSGTVLNFAWLIADADTNTYKRA